MTLPILIFVIALAMGVLLGSDINWRKLKIEIAGRDSKLSLMSMQIEELLRHELFLEKCLMHSHNECKQLRFERKFPYQGDVLKWAVDSFGEVALNRQERAARLIEEAIEVVQAEGVPIGVVSRIATRVYSRPVGELSQELGGLGITMLGLAANAQLNVIECTNREWDRVRSKSRDWWQQKHAEKVKAGTAVIA